MSNLTYYIVIAVAICMVTWGCKREISAPALSAKDQAINAAPSWDVYNKEGQKVERIKNVSGYLTSQAIPSPNGKRMTHPFIDLSSFDIMEEDFLSGLLKRANSFDEYVVLLKENDYKVIPTKRYKGKRKK